MILELRLTIKKPMNIVRKIIKNGVYWSFLRVIRRLKKPHNRSIKLFMDSIYSIKNKFIQLSASQVHENKNFVAVYDLSSNSISYDFAFFLAAAESYSIKKGCTSFFVNIIRVENDAFKGSAYSEIFDEESLKWKLDNIIIPLISLYPKCSGYKISPRYENIQLLPQEKIIYPQFYSANYSPTLDYKEIFLILKENKFTGFRASKQGIRYINLWLKKKNITRRVVTITLRNYNFDTSRNSNIDEWVKFANWLIKEGFSPVFLPDTDSSFIPDERLSSFFEFVEPSWNLGLRMALYENSYLNFVTSGPAAIAKLNRKVRYIDMHPIIEESQEASKKNFEKMGLEVGENYNFSNWYQILSWKDDNFKNITKEFQDFLLIEKKSVS